MKNKRKIYFLLLFFISFVMITYAADPPPVDGDPTGGGGTPIGGSAPIDSGYLITLSLAIAYGTYTFIKNNIHLKLFSHEK